MSLVTDPMDWFTIRCECCALTLSMSIGSDPVEMARSMGWDYSDGDFGICKNCKPEVKEEGAG